MIPFLDASEREQSAKQALRDVEFDYRLGNLEAADYADLREKYERRALVALKARVERERAADEVIDQQLARLRMQQAKQRGAGRPPVRGASAAAHSPESAPPRQHANGTPPSVRGPSARRRKGV